MDNLERLMKHIVVSGCNECGRYADECENFDFEHCRNCENFTLASNLEGFAQLLLEYGVLCPCCKVDDTIYYVSGGAEKRAKAAKILKVIYDGSHFFYEISTEGFNPFTLCENDIYINEADAKIEADKINTACSFLSKVGSKVFYISCLSANSSEMTVKEGFLRTIYKNDTVSLKLEIDVNQFIEVPAEAVYIDRKMAEEEMKKRRKEIENGNH